MSYNDKSLALRALYVFACTGFILTTHATTCPSPSPSDYLGLRIPLPLTNLAVYTPPYPCDLYLCIIILCPPIVYIAHTAVPFPGYLYVLLFSCVMCICPGFVD